MIKFSNDIYIYFALEKEIGKIVVLKKHAETLCSILRIGFVKFLIFHLFSKVI